MNYIDYIEFIIIRDSQKDALKWLAKLGSPLGIERFYNGLPVSIKLKKKTGEMSERRYTLSLDTFATSTWKPRHEQPDKNESIDLIMREARKMYLFISLRDNLLKENILGIRNSFSQLFALWGNTNFTDINESHIQTITDTLLPVFARIYLEGIGNAVLRRVDIRLQAPGLFPILSSEVTHKVKSLTTGKEYEAKGLIYENLPGRLHIQPCCLLAELWYNLIRDIQEGLSVGICPNCFKEYKRGKGAKFCSKKCENTFNRRDQRAINKGGKKPTRTLGY